MEPNLPQTTTSEQQRKIFHTRFENAVIIATKPLGDLVEAFNGYVQSTNAFIAEQNREITALRGRLVTMANKDVPVPPASAADPALTSKK